MRTLKRTLCLILALVMVLSLGAFSVSATGFADDADVKEEDREAIEVLTAVGMLKGDENGKVNPDEPLTRAAGAILFARLMGYANEAGSAPFSDTEAYDSWASGAIAYAQSQGVVVGYGDGRFGPGDALTGYAFAKMLLVALGYDAGIESLVGNVWTVSTATLAKKNGLSWNTLDMSATLTRAQAARMALNALQADIYEYDSRGVVIKNADGSEVLVNASPARTVPTANDWGFAIDDDVAGNYVNVAAGWRVQLGESLYLGDLEKVGGEADAFGRPAHVWKWKNKEIIKCADTASIVLTAATSVNDLMSELRGLSISLDVGGGTDSDVLKEDTLGDNDLALVTNSNYDADTAEDKTVNNTGVSLNYVSGRIIAVNGEKDYALSVPDTTNVAAQLAKLTGDGRRVEFFTRNNRITAIVVVQYTVAKVNAISSASNGTVSYNIKGLTTRYDYPETSSNSDTIVVSGSIAKNDWVTYVDLDGTAYVYPTTVISGKQSNINAVANSHTAKITVDGTVYPIGTAVVENAIDSYKNSTTARNFYLDQYGYVVSNDEINTEKDYAVIEAITYEGAGNGIDTDSKVTAKLAFKDGTTSTVKVKEIRVPNPAENTENFYKMSNSANYTKATWGPVDNAGDNGSVVGVAYKLEAKDTGKIGSTAYNANNNEILHGQIVYYSSGSSGYTLTLRNSANANGDLENSPVHSGLVTSAVTNGYVTQKGVPSFYYDNTHKANADADTVYLVATGDGNATGDVSYSVYKGYANVPSIKGVDLNNGMRVSFTYANNDSKVADFVFINAYNGKTEPTAKDIVYLSKDVTYNEYEEGSNTYRSIEVLLNGEVKTIVAKSSDARDAVADAVTEARSSNYGTIWLVRFDGDGYIDTFESDKANISIVTAELKGTVFEGLAITSSTKYIIIEDGKVVEGDASVAVANSDAYYVKRASGDNTSADWNKIDTLYILKNASDVVALKPADGTGAAAIENAQTLQNKLKASDTANVTVTNENAAINTQWLPGGQLVIGANDELTFTNGVDLTNGSTIIVQGTLTITDDQFDMNALDDIAVEAGGTLIVNGNVVVAGNTLYAIEGSVLINGKLTINGHVALYNANLLVGEEYNLTDDVAPIKIGDDSYALDLNRFVVTGGITCSGKLDVYIITPDTGTTPTNVGNAVFTIGSAPSNFNISGAYIASLGADPVKGTAATQSKPTSY